MIDTRKGFALVYFLLISLIIVMMTGAVLTMGHEGLAATRSGVDANRALYAAEAGMTDLIAKLERDPAFGGSADELELSDKTSRYSFEFQAPSAATALQCVNNLYRSSSFRSVGSDGSLRIICSYGGGAGRLGPGRHSGRCHHRNRKDNDGRGCADQRA